MGLWIIFAVIVGFMMGVATMCLMAANGPDDDQF